MSGIGTAGGAIGDSGSGSVGRIVYLHGFRSSPASFKARMIGERLVELGQGERFVCPQLPASPAAALALVLGEIAPGPDDVLIGSSLGGFYATCVAERRACRAVLLNPAMHPARDLRGHVGEQTMYHDNEPFVFEARYIDEFAAMAPAGIADPSRYFLVAAKGDELLDWREMVAAFPGARTRLIE
ncbi:MAG: YqiA/YcfP family alpha/beta fold hydrolase, partial [Burkholderiaceae bacterium]